MAPTVAANVEASTRLRTTSILFVGAWADGPKLTDTAIPDSEFSMDPSQSFLTGNTQTGLPTAPSTPQVAPTHGLMPGPAPAIRSSPATSVPSDFELPPQLYGGEPRRTRSPVASRTSSASTMSAHSTVDGHSKASSLDTETTPWENHVDEQDGAHADLFLQLLHAEQQTQAVQLDPATMDGPWSPLNTRTQLDGVENPFQTHGYFTPL